MITETIAILTGAFLSLCVIIALWERAVEADPSRLEDVPEQFKTQEICNRAVNKKPYSLKYVPERFKTQEMCNRAVKADPSRLEDVPEQFKRLEMCLKALKCDINLFDKVPERFNEDPKCDELGRCKGGDGKCEASYFDDGPGTTKNCRKCKKVVCSEHGTGCWWCNGNPEDDDYFYCYDCCYETRAYLCNNH